MDRCTCITSAQRNEPSWNSTCKYFVRAAGNSYGYIGRAYNLYAGGGFYRVSCYTVTRFKKSSCTNTTVTFGVYEKKAVANIVYSKGTTQYTDVTSTSSSAYPSNGYQSGYWYVYKGAL